MVVFLLYMKAELENIGSITLVKDANLRISVKNPLSDYETREDVVINASEVVDQEDGSREPDHHFRLSWDGSKKPSTLTILSPAQAKTALKKKKGVTLPRESYTESGSFAPILAVECRGLEPCKFSPMGEEFTATSTEGYEFDAEAVDMSDEDWAEYDAENDLPVGISEVEFKWEAV